jgi:putative transposase
MGKHQRKWSKAEKLNILALAKTEGVTKAARQLSVSPTMVYRWRDKVEALGEEGLGPSDKTEMGRELDRLARENRALKEIIAEKELKLRIQDALLQKKT